MFVEVLTNIGHYLAHIFLKDLIKKRFAKKNQNDAFFEE